MRLKIQFLASLIITGMAGCDNGQGVSKEIESINSELDQLQSKLVADEPNTDRNGDGKSDLFIEYEDGFVYELYDRDFDGKVDESWKYDSNDILISGRVDDDLDGILETEYIYKDHSLDKMFSDTNGNLISDVYTKLNRGVAVYSEKYYSSKEGSRIGRVEYSFGYPDGPEKLVKTLISESEFENIRK
ncbi:MAG: hypothetical protein KC446_06170 [Flavobacteriales bacterium]|nr:hypothetical protein [Flavobacteriales bacterium]